MKSIHFLNKLQEREEQGLWRSLEEPQGVDFCSNDYLSFHSDVVLRRETYQQLENVASGSTSSRLIRGHYPEIAQLELKLAKWCEREASLYFSSGYQANIAVMSTILDKESVVFSDEWNHASIVDGIRLSRGEKIIFRHNDLVDLEQKLQTKINKTKFVVVESLYSMQGDQSPLKEMVALCQKYQAQLIVDEAHATGVYGSGLVARQNLQANVLLTVHCAGKALGVSGAWIACDSLVREYFINLSRPFIYSTAPSPLVVSALTTALSYWERVGAERAVLCLDKANQLKQQLSIFLREEMLLGSGPILFIRLGNPQEALAWSQYFKHCGFDIRAIRYPTVPAGQDGLRVSLHASQAPEEISQLVRAFKEKVLAC